MRRLALTIALFTATHALAEGGWLTSRGRLQPELHLQAWGGTDSFGLGLVSPDQPRALAGLAVELLYGWHDRNLEVRGGRIWQFTPTQTATASATVSGVANVVPEGFDAGLGVRGTLALSLGGDHFTVDLAYELGVDVFARATVRVPQRGTLGLNTRFGDFGVGLQGKLGADIIVGAHFVGRGEVMLSLSWFGLGKALGAK